MLSRAGLPQILDPLRTPALDASPHSLQPPQLLRAIRSRDTFCRQKPAIDNVSSLLNCRFSLYLRFPPPSSSLALTLLFLPSPNSPFSTHPKWDNPPKQDNMGNTTLYTSALIAGLTAALFGYSVGFIGGIIILPSFLSHFSLSHLSPSALASTQAQIITSWLVGALFGVPLGMPFCSRFGRKGCLLFSAVLYVLGAALQLCDIGGIGGFEIGRALNGLGVGVGTLGGPM